MKKGFTLAFAILCLTAVLLGCAKTEQENNGQSYFTAKIVEIYDDFFMVDVTDQGNSSVAVGDRVEVPSSVVSADGCPDLAVGAYARIVFNGEVMETYPLKLGTVFAIYEADETGAVIPD